uniref:Uncharacterized protein n=1 Tax=Magnetococcus massalia (strain MO-1) TaxID=451514 RepID=A0A1S7LF47_MAGMO|nr:conserved exported protein of unknown function [Candidatus Magnetococcus massalia]
MSNTTRLVLLGAALIAAVLLPYTLSEAYGNYMKYQQANLTVLKMKRLEQRTASHKAAVMKYKNFQQQTEGFIQAAAKHGVAKDGWIHYQVDIEDQPVDGDQLDFLLSNARNSDRYYFEPSQLVLTAPTHSSVMENMALRKRLMGSDEESQGGEKIMITMKGTYLVYQAHE